MNYILVGIGGALGACIRYSLSFLPITTNFPIITLAINFSGSLILTYLFYRMKNRSRKLYLFITTGVISGFTTFSTFSLETITLLESGFYSQAFFYSFVSLAGSLLFAIIGALLAKGGQRL